MYKYDLIVMGFLLDRPMHGYEINRQVKWHQMDSWAQIKYPMIYMALRKLEKQGMITNARIEREGLMPERRIYRLTTKGERHLAKLVEKSLLDQNLTGDMSNLGYFFIFALNKDDAMECLNRRKKICERTIRSLHKRREEVRDRTPINRFLVIEKDVDRFKSELLHLRKMINKLGNCTEWRADAISSV